MKRIKTKVLVKWAVRIIVAVVALLIIMNIVEPMIAARLTEYGNDLATDQMAIEGSQAYTVHHDILQYCTGIAWVVKMGIIAYMVWCMVKFVIENKGETEE